MQKNEQAFNERQSMKNELFEIFHYRDHKPVKVRPHAHNFYEIYFFVNGDVTFNVEGQQHALQPGEILLINPMELHQVHVAKNTLYDRIVLWINCDYLDALGGESVNLAACFDSSRPEHRNLLHLDHVQQNFLLALLERLNEESYGGHLGSDVYAETLLIQLLLEINRLIGQTPVSGAEQLKNDLIGQVILYIGDHFVEPLTLEDLAARFYISKSRLSHKFQQQVGTSIYQYILFRRLTQARELLRQGNVPGEVYQRCGFRDYSNFYRAFRHEYGVAPQEFVRAKL